MARKIREFIIEPIEDEHVEELRKHTTSQTRAYVDSVISPPGCMLNKKFSERLEHILDLEIFPDDTWVITFPKSGTTWTQEMVWLLQNNLNFSQAKETKLNYRFPFLEFQAIHQDVDDNDIIVDTLTNVKNAPRPRFIKSHLPVELLPTKLWTVKPKIVFVSRDPRDVVISFYHHQRLWTAYTGSFEKYFEAFINDRILYGPFWGHFLGWMKLKNSNHILFNTYEEMKTNLPNVIRRTAKFLNVNLSEIDVEKLNDHLSFKSMKENKSVNYSEEERKLKNTNNIVDPDLSFIRSGKSGGWKSVLNDEMVDKIENWTKKWLQGTSYSEYPNSLVDNS